MSSPAKRRELDIMKLLMADYDVSPCDDDRGSQFYVSFKGPKDTPYEGGTWKVLVYLPDGYPYQSPSIGFVNQMYHPNVDERSGTVCLDVINQSWSPMYNLVNIFEVFLPQLLTYPNFSDPLNPEAAALHMRDAQSYNAKVRELVQKYAQNEDFQTKGSENQERTKEVEAEDQDDLSDGFDDD